MRYNNTSRFHYILWRSGITGRSRLHFRFCVDGKHIIYCYIRKNACTAFKKFICDIVAPNAAFTNNRLDFLIQHCKAQQSDFKKADEKIFVYRDPISRVVSFYKNKVIQNVVASDRIARRIGNANINGANLTFSKFVDQYLALGVQDIDIHLRTQHSHLLPIRYTRSINIQELHSSMRDMVGVELADNYFKVPENSTTATTSPRHEGVFDCDPSQLRSEYENSGELPCTAAFLNPRLEQLIESYYRKDVEMIKRIHAAQT